MCNSGGLRRGLDCLVLWLCLGLCGLLLTGCHADRCTPAAPVLPPNHQRTQVLIIAAGSDCDGRHHELENGVRAAADELSDAIIGRGGPKPVQVVSPRRCEVEAHVKSLDARPLMLVYIGHGRLEADCDGDALNDCRQTEQWCCDSDCGTSSEAPRQSNLCLADGELSVNQIVEWIPWNVPEALVVVDACCSADVDLRRSRVPTSLLSATPLRVFTDRGRPVLTGRMAAGLREIESIDGETIERNMFGIRTDEELFDYVRQVARLDDAHSVLPKLRKNTAKRLALPGSATDTAQTDDDAPLWWLEDPGDPVFDPELESQALALDRAQALQLAASNPHLAIYEVDHDEVGQTLTLWRLPERLLVGRADVAPGRRLTDSALRRIKSTPLVEYDQGRCVLRFPETLDLKAERDPRLISRPCVSARGQCFISAGEERCR